MSRDVELERAYEEMLATMQSPGWALIIEDFGRLRDHAADVRHCDNLEFNKGQLDVLDLLFGWKEATEKAYQQLMDPPAVEAE